jgi:hypothetical protein
MNIADVRRQGFRVKVNHYRFRNDDIKKVRSLAIKAYDPNYLNKEHTRIAKLLNIEPFHASSFGDGRNISSLGGVTEVILEKDGAIYLGASHCALVDNYNRKDGITRALGRALGNVKHKICL